MGKPLLFAILLFSLILTLGCTSRNLKTAVCYAQIQPSENKCLEKLAIDTKDTTPCDKITDKFEKNGSILFPNKVSCYAEVAYRKGEIGICNQLKADDSKQECIHRFDLYIDSEKYRNVAK